MSKHVTIVSHDAGGAEILSSWLKRNNFYANVVVAGPAEKIFRSKFAELKFLNLDDALNKTKWLITGTGWESNFEKEAIYKARNLGIKTVAFIDHWVNYRERFELNGNTILPDEIWVGDKDAERIANQTFPQTPIIFCPNPYLEDIKNEISIIKKKIKNESKLRFLYVCEPIAKHAFKQYGNERYWGYTEVDALEYFLKNFNIFHEPVKSITIRPHPSENKDKYLWLKDFKHLPIQIGGEQKLIEEITSSDIVVGCESMAMIIALIANRSVICSIPPGGRPCQLPHSKIQSLQNLIQTKEEQID